MNDDNKKLFELQTNELYASFGKFAVSFEALCEKMSSTIAAFLHNGGLSHHNSKMADALLAGQTADPLLKILTSFLAMVFPGEDDKKIISNYAKFVKELIEYRNNTIHRFWHIGYASVDDTDFSVTGGYKVVNTSEGPDFRYIKSTAKEFNLQASKASHLEKITFDIRFVHSLGRTLTSRYTIGNSEYGIDIIIPPEV